MNVNETIRVLFLASFRSQRQCLRARTSPGAHHVAAHINIQERSAHKHVSNLQASPITFREASPPHFPVLIAEPRTPPTKNQFASERKLQNLRKLKAFLDFNSKSYHFSKTTHCSQPPPPEIAKTNLFMPNSQSLR